MSYPCFGLSRDELRLAISRSSLSPFPARRTHTAARSGVRIGVFVIPLLPAGFKKFHSACRRNCLSPPSYHLAGKEVCRQNRFPLTATLLIGAAGLFRANQTRPGTINDSKCGAMHHTGEHKGKKELNSNQRALQNWRSDGRRIASHHPVEFSADSEDAAA
jgi:hypothetical protein